MNKILIIILCSSLVACFSSYSLAGNRPMVEKSGEELDSLNKEAVQQIPDLPEKGRVDLKTDVTYKNEAPIFNLRYKKITTEKEGVINFGGNQGEQKSKQGTVEENDDKDN